MCRVSVIIPIYNEEKYIETAVKAVLSQTLRDFELILVNDGSTDKTPEVCERLKKSDDRIILINKKNGGVASARNEGMKAAKGRYIYFTDADDYIEKTLLEDICEMAEKTGADVVEFGFIKEIYNSHDHIRKSEKILPGVEGVMNSGELAKNIKSCFAATSFYISGHVFLKTAIDNIIFSDMPLAEDSIFVIKALKTAKTVAFCRKAYYHYAVRIGSAVNRWQSRRLECDLILMDTLKEMLCSIGCSEADLQMILNDRCAGSYLNVIYNLSLPDCKIRFPERYKIMNDAKKQLRVNEKRKQFYSKGKIFERVKYFILRHNLELFMLMFGKMFIKTVR